MRLVHCRYRLLMLCIDFGNRVYMSVHMFVYLLFWIIENHECLTWLCNRLWCRSCNTLQFFDLLLQCVQDNVYRNVIQGSNFGTIHCERKKEARTFFWLFKQAEQKRCNSEQTKKAKATSNQVFGFSLLVYDEKIGLALKGT